MHSGYLRHVTHTENEVNELGDAAESCTKAERRVKRLKHEDGKFNEEHYMLEFSLFHLSLPVISYSCL